jgi:cellulose biosynthesis protein BcsQ
VITYAFWNNKGGTGKTSIAFQAICRFAQRSPDTPILALDLCPQANLSELLLGGLENHGSDNLLRRQGETQRATVGGYFQTRLPSPYTLPAHHSPIGFLTKPSRFNREIPQNIDLLCGDPLLELQANAVSTLANNSIPGTNTWLAVIDWLRNFLSALEFDYTVAFIDANPSFSFYTQIALAAADRILVPVMADDSSRRAIQNAFSLVYGLRLPSEIYSQYAFATKLKAAGRTLPKVRLIAKNRLTQYMGPASAYRAVLHSIDQLVTELLASNPEIFAFDDIESGSAEVRDFQTTGVVAFARGAPFYAMHSGRMDVGGRRIQVNQDDLNNCREAIDGIVDKITPDALV